MNLDLTRQSLFTNLLYILLLSIVFWGSWIMGLESSPAVVTNIDSVGTSLGLFIDSQLDRWPTAGIIASVLLMFINSIIVARICVRNVLFLERSFMPALVYVIVSVGYFNSHLSFRPLFVSMLLLIASNLIFRSLNVRTQVTGKYLNIGFYFGLSAIIYPPAAFLLPLLLVALAMFRGQWIKEWISALIGIALPVFFSFYIEWLMGSNFPESFNNFITALTTSSEAMPALRQIDILKWVFIGTITLLTILSAIKFISRRKIYKPKQVKSYIYFMWMLLMMALIMIFAPCRSLYMLPIIAIPLAVIVPVYFNASRPTFLTNFLYALLIGGAVIIHLGPFLLR